VDDRKLSCSIRSRHAVSINRWPNTGTPVIHDDDDRIIERKIATNGFPFAVRYRLLNERIVVLPVLHQHRRPDFGDDRRP
jgi:hypothetical protein